MKNLAYLILFSNLAFAEEILRIDQSKIEKFTPFSHQYEMLMSDNCPHCMRQITYFKECVKKEDVVILIDNQSKLTDEQLKKVIQKKKIIYPTYLLNDELKKTYDYKGISPLLWITKGDVKRKFTGVIDCESLKANF